MNGRYLAAGAVLVAGVMALAVAAGRGWAPAGRPAIPVPAGAARVEPPAQAIVRRTLFVMGSYARIVASGEHAAAGVAAASEELQRLDAMLDRFRPDSAVSRINRAAGGPPVEVAAEVGQLVTLALEVAERTGGAFDPTVAPLVDLWGFGDSFDHRPPQTPPPADAVGRTLRLVNFRDVVVQAAGGQWRVGLRRPGMAIDLGALAQGFGADRAAAVLRQAGVRSALVDVGGEVVAVGDHPERGTAAGWRVGVQHPRASGEVVAVLSLADRALATSGDYERFFVDRRTGRRYTHLLDARTGWPATGLMSASVVHGSAAVADALATAVMILGPDKGLALVDAWPSPASAMAVTQDGTVRVTAGWPGQARAEVRP